MNEETLTAILGISLVVVVALCFIVLPLLALKRFLLAYEAKQKARQEARAGGKHQDPEPASPQRGTLRLIGFSLLIIIWGVMTGFGVGVFSQLFYIVFLVPLAMGISSGKMIVDVVKRLQLRTTSYVVVLSLLSAVVVYGSFHYTRYLGFLLEVSMEMSQRFPETAGEENQVAAKVFADYALQEETGHSGFLGYMLYRAQEGLSIGRWYRSSRTNLGPILTPLYWLLEFAIILCVTYIMGKSATFGGSARISPAVCESCGSRMSGEKHLGGTATANESALLDLIRQKDFAGMGRLMEANAELPSLEVYYRGCRACGKSQSQLVVRRAAQTAQGMLHFTDASRTVLQPGEGALLLSHVSLSGD
jgi:hypothetical protein